MILPILSVLLVATLTESLDEGGTCSLRNGKQGVCVLLTNCQSVKQQLISGFVPETSCGYYGTELIVCCPSSTPNTSSLTGDGRGAISRQKCGEYAQSVFVVKKIPILLGDQGTKNVSECAIDSQKLIVGGLEAEPGEFPHMAAIGFDTETGDINWACSGTLISEIFVLTAAHCTYSREFGDAMWVRVGDVNLMESVEDGASPEDRRITERIRHPEYKPSSFYHDIALIRLESRVPFNKWIRPACLNTAPTFETSKTIATGWGRADWDFIKDNTDLIKITLSVIDSKTCDSNWTSSGGVNRKLSNGVVDDWLICAGVNSPSICQGDSGGPLVIYSKPKYYCMYDVVGVTSLGKSCSSKLPGIYTRVYHYISWIESIVW